MSERSKIRVVSVLVLVVGKHFAPMLCLREHTRPALLYLPEHFEYSACCRRELHRKSIPSNNLYITRLSYLGFLDKKDGQKILWVPADRKQ